MTHIDTVDRRPEPTIGLALRRRVLVALSGPEAPHAAIAAGRLIAQALAAPLHGVLAWPTQITPCEVARLLHLDAALLEGMVLDVQVGDPADCMTHATHAHPVAFVVLVAERDARDPCGLGQLAVRTLAGSGVGTIVLKPGARLGPIRRILMPIDGTPSMAAALAPAGDLALRTGAALDVLMVEDTAAAPSQEHGTMASPQYVDQPQHEWPAFSAELLQRLVGAIARCPPSVPTRLLLGTGHPASEILRFADELDADLVTLLWGGYECTDGSVFREVVRGTDRPLLVLHR